MRKITIIAIASVFVLSSCKKDDPKVCTLSSTSIIGTYKATAATYQADAQSAPVDDYATWQACEKDDLFVIGNGTFSTSEGATSCTPPADPMSATWTLNGDQLTLDISGFTMTVVVESFTCTSMVIKQVDPVDNSITRTTLTRQ